MVKGWDRGSIERKGQDSGDWRMERRRDGDGKCGMGRRKGEGCTLQNNGLDPPHVNISIISIMRHPPVKHPIHLKESRCIIVLNAIMLKAASKKINRRRSFESGRIYTPKGKYSLLTIYSSYCCCCRNCHRTPRNAQAAPVVSLSSK